ncbi:MAG TPA: hypothetical protein VE997_08610 [Candidatus Limnocylindria bacterium]|nr:hypothetical protein [Candidatus Limnocylindria bacterium]
MSKVFGCGTLVLVLVALAPTAASGRAVRQPLRPTGVDPNAHGVAIASIHAKHHRGKFRVKARNLKPGATYGISVAGIRIGSFTTGAAGSGAARFTNPQHGGDQFLGVDPRGKRIEVSDDHGEDVLENEMPDDDDDQGKVQCCLAEDDEDEAEVECEEETADECTEKGGTNMGTGTCFPNPCPTTPPGPEVRCCLPDDDDDGPECEEESAAECSAAGGVNMGTGSCEPNPCAPAPPGVVTCCIAEHEEDEDDDEGESPEPPECERITMAHCAEEGGTVSSAASCEPNPCVSSPSGAFLN